MIDFTGAELILTSNELYSYASFSVYHNQNLIFIKSEIY